MSVHSGIWVGLLMTSSTDMAQNTQETFDCVSNAEKVYLGYLCFMFSFLSKMDKTSNERTVSSSKTIRSLATIRTATMHIFWSPIYAAVYAPKTDLVCAPKTDLACIPQRF